ncbi:acyl-CoA dehydrogenase family protein [Streptomyces sp. NPDC046909]|uniref:acyl-CoA dehydrogenase family protein n=1 Tax=Streptomyces sp. NPDC046909 TaxID=3155617 RepID=UPI0033E1D64D
MKLTAEHDELRSAVRSLLTRNESMAAWRPLTEQIGVAGLAVPEEYGGAGGGALEIHVVMEELGRCLSPVPFLGSSVLATQTLLASGDEAACATLLPSLAEGRTTATVAWAEHGTWDPATLRAQAVRGADDEWRITGTKEHVLDGATAGVLLVAARTDAGVSLFRVDTDEAGVHREPLVTMDQTRAQARIRLDNAPGRLVGEDGQAERALWHALDLACVALAAEQVGAAERCLELTVAYAKERVQFGRPIGSFQAVKHRLADMYVLVEGARSAALGAAVAALGDPSELARLSAVAKSACSEAFSAVAAETIQLHGGIGITWEHDAHRYFKRAHGSAQLFGSAAWHRRRLSVAVGLG